MIKGPRASILFAVAAGILCVVFVAGAQEGPPPGRPNLKERAAKGDAEAQFNLAKNYETGRGGLKKDFTEAEHWYQKSAEQGDPYAQASLGILYRFGKGVPQDVEKAYFWLYLASRGTKGGDQESINELLASAANRLRPDQIAMEKQLAEQWKPKPTQ